MHQLYAIFAGMSFIHLMRGQLGIGDTNFITSCLLHAHLFKLLQTLAYQIGRGKKILLKHLRLIPISERI